MNQCVVCDFSFTDRGASYRRYCKDCLPAVQKVREEANRHMRSVQFPDVQAMKCEDCGARAYAYDHRYYSMPLDVAPVCRACNAKRGPANDVRVLAREVLGLDKREVEPRGIELVVSVQQINLQANLDAIERELIVKMLQVTRFNRTAAAKLLGITFRSMRYRMERLNIG